MIVSLRRRANTTRRSASLRPSAVVEADNDASTVRTAGSALSCCVSLDLEVSKRSGRIHAFAGERPDSGGSVVYPVEGRTFKKALADLDDLADGATFLLGHNLITFDLPHLRAASPGLRLLGMPAVDTLWLSPLAFPRNPYHRLVKHYKDGLLARERRNDPRLDAQLALAVFADQQDQLVEAPAGLLTAWHWLTGRDGGTGFDLVFEALRGSARPDYAEAYAAMRACLDGVACESQARRSMIDDGENGWALAYALAWLSVSGGDSVMPPWVRHQFPDAAQLVRRLRDEPCADAACSWCRRRHDASSELKRFFGFDGFKPEPADSEGRSYQQVVVEAAMAGRDALAILPTGAGKSLCYQIPALSRYDKTGALTVVISPLVALMADQVAGLYKHGITSCVTVNGLLSMPERAEALERVRLGGAAVVLISPEQLRSVSVRRALQQREIGAWVLDEAHCLSKWGHDFRPDYRYVGRFIAENAAGPRVPPVLCLTATARPDVIDEIVDYFAKHLDIKLEVFDGGSTRTNLEFSVVETSASKKMHDIDALVAQHLPSHTDGGAIVYCRTRRHAEDVAEYLKARRVDVDRFHAGLAPDERKTIQHAFIDGSLRVIAATNAFGMGIDKPDVRLVIHADIPSSLESYFQETGRAGRDDKQAHCVLLYTADDVERQFTMSARSRLTRREIGGVLHALRSLNRRDRCGGVVVASPGEILKEDDRNDFRRDSTTDDTRVRTAVAWIEEAGLLRRDENHVRVFPSSLRVNSVEEARRKLRDTTLDDSYRRSLLGVAAVLINADIDEGISTDMLMGTSGLDSDQVRELLYDLERFGIASNDTALTAFVHVGVQRSSTNRLTAAAALERHLIDLMREAAPGLEVGDTVPLNVRVATQRLKDAGLTRVRPEQVSSALQGIARDGRGAARAPGGNLIVRKHDADSVQVTLRRDWSSLSNMADRRRGCAARLLDHLLDENTPGRRGVDLLVATTLGNLTSAAEFDLTLRGQVWEPRKLRNLMERALLWLHEQDVITLNRGLTVFRPAITVVLDQRPRGFRQTDFEPLKFHYERSVRQIHVMSAFAQRSLVSADDARHLAVDYFALRDNEFLQRWLPKSGPSLGRQTTPESWNKIVGGLRNPAQRDLVADDRENANVLVLAGPGSGKTTVLVHRIAYLIRVRREDPRGILALSYNRHAAVEIRRRLYDLIGDDSRGVMVSTCHALAMRLVGASLSGHTDQVDAPAVDSWLNEVLSEATALLRGDGLEPEDSEESRRRLLAGFRWLLVDEYQDIAAGEYELISALAGRTARDADSRLGLFAVGDDDQNIYAFNGASVEFIRSFERDYKAKSSFLTDNYRSTAHIIAAANAVIAPAGARMKADHAIRVNRRRAKDPPGGRWAAIDQVGGGKVQVLRTASNSAVSQAQSAVAELVRLSSLDPDWDWSRCAVIARAWKYLEPVRTVCGHDGIPVQVANDESLSLWHLRETQALVGWARRKDPGMVRSVDAAVWLERRPHGTWNDMLSEALEEHAIETGGVEVPVASFVEWLAEWARAARRRQRGLLLLTAHRAKGLEFDHVVVLDGAWGSVSRDEDPDAPRRLYYVAMTRARHTLALSRLPGPHPFQDALRDNPSVRWRDLAALPPPTPELARRHRPLALRDVYLSFAGYKAPNDRTHRSIAALSPGDPLDVQPQSDRWELSDTGGVVVGTLARRFEPPRAMRCIGATVHAVATWRRDYAEPQYRRRLRNDVWEVVVPELVFEPDESTVQQSKAGQRQY